jgi:hypothetical protein
VGDALQNQDAGSRVESWGRGSSAPAAIREHERALEQRVTAIIGEMSLLWLAGEDEPGSASARGHIERNAIALLSNWDKPALDPPSPGWLGLHSMREKVRRSGLWNNHHVEDGYDPTFLDVLARLIRP